MPYTIDNHGIATLVIPDTYSVKERYDLRFEIDTTVSSIDLGTALGYLENTLKGEYGGFMQSGCRNNQAVNMSIALHVLGYDPSAWLEEHLPVIREHALPGFAIDETDYDLFKEHLNRVSHYLADWSHNPWRFTLDS